MHQTKPTRSQECPSRAQHFTKSVAVLVAVSKMGVVLQTWSESQWTVLLGDLNFLQMANAIKRVNGNFDLQQDCTAAYCAQHCRTAIQCETPNS